MGRTAVHLVAGFCVGLFAEYAISCLGVMRYGQSGWELPLVFSTLFMIASRLGWRSTVRIMNEEPQSGPER
jgi:hypothetical protein